eukprot:6766449-Karenia_brevis.AAC.1
MPSGPSAVEKFPWLASMKDRILHQSLEVGDPIAWHRCAPMERQVRAVSAKVTAKPKAKVRSKNVLKRLAAAVAEEPE